MRTSSSDDASYGIPGPSGKMHSQDSVRGFFLALLTYHMSPSDEDICREGVNNADNLRDRLRGCVAIGEQAAVRYGPRLHAQTLVSAGQSVNVIAR